MVFGDYGGEIGGFLGRVRRWERFEGGGFWEELRFCLVRFHRVRMCSLWHLKL